MRLVQMEAFWPSHTSFSPPLISTSDDSYPSATAMCNCLLNNITHILIIKYKWSRNQCWFFNCLGEMTFFHRRSRITADMASYADSSSFAYIKVSGGNKRYVFLLPIQVLKFFQFTRSFTCMTTSLIPSAKSWFNRRIGGTSHADACRWVL